MPSYSTYEPPAIPAEKYYMPGEWASCDVCRTMRMIVNLTSICYTFARIPGYTRCLKFCADNEKCRHLAMERQHNASL